MTVQTTRLLDAEGDLFLISFDWTDINDLVPEVKKIPGRRFNPDKKVWTVPSSSVSDVAEFARDHKLTVSPAALALGKAARLLQNSSKALTTDLEIDGLANDLLPFQRAGVEYALRVRRTFIGDEVGLGKTAQALATIHSANAYPAVVVVKAVSCQDWMREVTKWTPTRSAEVLSGEKPMTSTADIVIVGWPVLKYHLNELLRRAPQAAIFDESHFAKSGKAQRTKAALKLSKAVPADGFVLNLTATAQKNRPVELITQLDLLGQLGKFGGFWGFARRYCEAHQIPIGGHRMIWDLTGSSHLDELNERLRATCMVRRRKKDVLPELPPVRHAPVYLEIDNLAEYQKAEQDVISYLNEMGDYDKAGSAEKAEALVQINVLRQLAAKGKLSGMTEWIEDFGAEDEKLLVFGWHKHIVELLAATFKCPGVTGDTDKKRFDDEVDKFQTDPEAKMLVINMLVGGESKTLTAASNVAFAEFGWNRATHDQAIGRAYGRLNDAHGVTAWYFVGVNTIDESMLDLADEKGRSADATLDGEMAKQEESAVKRIIEKLQQKGKVA